MTFEDYNYNMHNEFILVNPNQDKKSQYAASSYEEESVKVNLPKESE
jgi:biopolymer transport protein ExbD